MGQGSGYYRPASIQLAPNQADWVRVLDAEGQIHLNLSIGKSLIASVIRPRAINRLIYHWPSGRGANQIASKDLFYKPLLVYLKPGKTEYCLATSGPAPILALLPGGARDPRTHNALLDLTVHRIKKNTALLGLGGCWFWKRKGSHSS